MSNGSISLYKSEIIAHYMGKCVYCGIAISKSTTELDHVVPRSQKGKTTLRNLVPTCKACNREKNDKPPPVPVQLPLNLINYRIFPRVQQLVAKARKNGKAKQ